MVVFCVVSIAPSMMSLRQRHMDSQLAMGSQRLVETCLLAGQQGDGTSNPTRSRATLQKSHSQSFQQFEALPLPPLSSAVSHPAIICSSPPLSYRQPHSFHSSSSLHASAPHSSHVYHSSYFQPMDTIPDFQRSSSFGYPSALFPPHSSHAREIFSLPTFSPPIVSYIFFLSSLQCSHFHKRLFHLTITHPFCNL